MDERPCTKMLLGVSHAVKASWRKAGLSVTVWRAQAWGKLLLLTDLLLSSWFPETTERALGSFALGLFVCLFVCLFSQQWFYGLFHKLPFPATSCWCSRSVWFLRFLCLRTKKSEVGKLRSASLSFSCSAPPPNPHYDVLLLTSEYQWNMRVKRRTPTRHWGVNTPQWVSKWTPRYEYLNE